MSMQLPNVDYVVTGRCNRRCRICYTPSPFGIEDASTDDAKRTFDLLAKIGLDYSNICGGEPLLRKDLGEIVKHAHDNGINVYLSTNGSLLLKRYEELAPYLKWIGLSLDGSTSEVTKRMKNDPTQVGIVREILKYFDHHPPSHGIRVGTVVSQKNHEDVPNIGEILVNRNGGNDNGAYIPDVWKLYQYCERGPRQRHQLEYRIDGNTFHSASEKAVQRHGGNIPIDVNPKCRMNGSYLLILPDLSLVVPVHDKYIRVGSLRGKDAKYLKDLIARLSEAGKFDLEKAPTNRSWLQRI